MPAIDMPALCIPAECDTSKYPFANEIASRWDAYCYATFTGISLRLCSISLRSFRITFAVYLPTHIKSLRDFFQSSLNNPLVCGLRLRLESTTPHHQRRPPQRGRWHRPNDKNRSTSAKNQTSKIRVSESTNKMIPEFFLHWQM